MRNIFICLAFILCLPIGPVAAAADNDADRNTLEGLQALQDGDQEKFFEHALKDAEGGLAEAQLAVASMYEKGVLGAPQDNAKALYWYRRSAAQENALAEARMAEICIQGKLMPRDWTASLEWLKKSAAHGNAKANDYIGDSYLIGRGVERNMATAVSYYLKAANANVVGSQIKLGGFYLQGRGAPVDVEESYFWLYVANKNPGSAAFKDLSGALDVVRQKLSPEAVAKVEKRADVFVASFAGATDAPYSMTGKQP